MKGELMKGFIITVTNNLDEADVWFKNVNGRVQRIAVPYHPDFYVEPEDIGLDELCTALSSHPNIVKLTLERKRPSLSSFERAEVIRVHVDEIANYKRVLNDISKLSCKTYNSDLVHGQRVLFNLNAPCLILVEYDGEVGFKLVEESLNLEPPMLRPLSFRVYASTSGVEPSPKVDPIVRIAAYGGEDLVFEGDEHEILEELSNFTRIFDPDLIVTPKLKFTLKYLRIRASLNDLKLNFGRTSNFEFKGSLAFNGRVLIDLADYEHWGLAGLAELCHYSMLPPDLAARWPIGRLVDSRQCYEAFKRDVLLPIARSHSILFRSLALLHRADRGGLTFNPQPGIYENVCQLDFDSQYPHIIVRYNVSYETVMGLGEIINDRKGFLAEVAEPWLKRRLHLKHLARTLPKNNPHRIYADERQKALKAMLVVIYGYSGCVWNRFSNVKCFEEINEISRRVLVKAVRLAEERGFKVIYADVDSLFIHKLHAGLEEYEELCKAIAEETRLPISIENWFKFLVLLPQRANTNMGATKRYYGRLMSGELHFKGIEARRRDHPEYIREIQVEMMDKLLRGDSLSDVKMNVVEVLGVLNRAIKELYDRRVPIEKLAIYNVIRRNPIEYTSKFPHVSAALQLQNIGLKINKGKLIGYIYTNSKNSNPLLKVQCMELLDGRSYDEEKYVEMLLEAAETILSPLKLRKGDLKVLIADLLRRKHVQLKLQIFT